MESDQEDKDKRSNNGKLEDSEIPSGHDGVKDTLDMSHEDLSDVSLESENEQDNDKDSERESDKDEPEEEKEHAGKQRAEEDDEPPARENEKMKITDLRQKLEEKKNQLRNMEEKQQTNGSARGIV